MNATIACPTCQTPLSITPQLIGSIIACPVCQRQIHLTPAANSPPSRPAAPLPMPRANSLPQYGGASASASSPTAIPAAPILATPPMIQAAPLMIQSVKPAAKPRKQSLAAPLTIGVVVVALVAVGIMIALKASRQTETNLAAVGDSTSSQPANAGIGAQTSIPQTSSSAAAPIATTANESSTQPNGSGQATTAAEPPSGTAPIVEVQPQVKLPDDSADARSTALSLPSEGSARVLPPSFSPPATAPTELPSSSSSSGSVSPSVTFPSTTIPSAGSSPRAATGASVWRLPTLLSAEEQSLGDVVGSESGAIDLAISTVATNLPGNAAVYTERAKDEAAWQVFYTSNIDLVADKIALGTFRHKGPQFSFQWLTPFADPAIRRSLANCRVELRQDNAIKVFQLRPIVSQAACKLDLNLETQNTEFPVLDLPKLELLRLNFVRFDQINDLDLPPESLELGRSKTIPFRSPKGAELEVKFFKHSAGHLVLRVEPTFRESSTVVYPMTLPRLDTMEEKSKDLLADAIDEIPKQRSSLAQYQSELASARSIPMNIHNKSAVEAKISSAASKITRAVRRIESLQKQIPIYEARISAAPSIRQFLESLHNEGAIAFQIVAECGEHDLVLVDGTSQVAKRQATP